MITGRHLAGRVLVTIAAVAWATPGRAQETRPALYLSIGSFHHSSDLHPYYASRFDDALVIGGGLSLPLHRVVVARVVIERAVTQLSGGPAVRENRGSDNIMAAEVQLTATVSVTDRLRPYAGAGIGLRRYVVNSVILSDDVIHSPWAEPQIQPAFSAVAGVSVSLTRTVGVAAELRWSRARFRAGDDTWGLPEDPVAWQQEFRPAFRFEVSPW